MNSLRKIIVTVAFSSMLLNFCSYISEHSIEPSCILPEIELMLENTNPLITQ